MMILRKHCKLIAFLPSLVLQESSTIQDLTVTIEEDMCFLSLEWSEAIVSCDGISVNYNLTLTPDTEDSTAVDIYSGTENRYNYTVNGSAGLQYSFNLTTEVCGGQTFTMSGPVNLSGTYYYTLNVNCWLILL